MTVKKTNVKHSSETNVLIYFVSILAAALITVSVIMLYANANDPYYFYKKHLCRVTLPLRCLIKRTGTFKKQMLALAL